MLAQTIQRSWYQNIGFITILLLPLSIIFCAVSLVRRHLYRTGVLQSTRLPVPVIVVGNISVGGTGKTPLVIAIVQHLKANGFNPGVISRGYGGRASQWPQAVTAESDPAMVGDETVLIANRCRCPVSVGPDRVAAARALLDAHQCNIIISDDGMQHYALARDIEIAVIDGSRRLGNGLCLPAGPLRELPGRLQSVDLVVCNGKALDNEFGMELKSYAFHSVNDESNLKPTNAFEGVEVEAVSAIGNNERFFQHLQDLGIRIKKHAFTDHHRYRQKDLRFKTNNPILMTEKDAVKCTQFMVENAWYLRVDALLENRFYERLTSLIGKHNG
ncbi:tetraacyldisaccharide 4'-kinase [Kaarinaea lacus]